MIFQFVSFSAINLVASAFNYLFQYFASLRLDQISFSHFIALVAVANFFGILSTIFRNHSTILFFEEKFNFTPRLKRILRTQKILTLLLLVAGGVVGWFYKRDQFTAWQVLLTVVLIYFSMAAAPLVGMLQAKKDYNRIAFYSLGGAFIKIAAGTLLLIYSTLAVKTEHYLLFMAVSALFVFVLFKQTTTRFTTEEEDMAIHGPDHALIISALGTLCIALINSFDSILFLHVLNENDSAIFGKYVLIGKAGMVAFEMLIFTLFPYFLEGKKIPFKILAGFVFITTGCYFMMDLLPIPLLNMLLTKIFMNLHFDDILFQDYWHQIIFVGLTSLFINFLMAKKKMLSLSIALVSAVVICFLAANQAMELHQFVARNKNFMSALFLLVVLLSFFPDDKRRSE